MSMERDFFPLKPLVHDRLFGISFTASLLATIVFGAFAVFSLLQSKIAIDPIAAVMFVAAPPPHVATATVSEFASRSDSDKVFAAYITNLENLCKQQESNASVNAFPDVSAQTAGTQEPGQSAVLLVTTDGQVTAGTSKISGKTCSLVKNLPDNKAIYVASDRPLPNSHSEKAYLALDKAK